MSRFQKWHTLDHGKILINVNVSSLSENMIISFLCASAEVKIYQLKHHKISFFKILHKDE